MNETLKNRLQQVILEYENKKYTEDFNAEDMAAYLMKIINEPGMESQDVLFDTYKK